MRVVKLCAVAVVVACSADAGTPPFGNTGVLSIDPAAIVDTADGTRLVALAAHVDTSFKAANSVSFVTTLGTFTNGTATVTATPDSLGVARVYLKAPTDSSGGTVTATASTTARSINVLFVPAVPEWIAVSGGTTAAKIGATGDVTATPVRVRGKVTPGGYIRFELENPAQKPNVRFSVDSIPVAQEQVKTQLTWLSADTGSVRVKASYVRDRKVITSNTTTVTFFKPASATGGA
jgi:hypothetical protein